MMSSSGPVVCAEVLSVLGDAGCGGDGQALDGSELAKELNAFAGSASSESAAVSTQGRERQPAGL